MKTLVTAILLTIFAVPVVAQQWQWPDKPKNLQVVPLNIEMHPNSALFVLHLADHTKAGGISQAATGNTSRRYAQSKLKGS